MNNSARNNVHISLTKSRSTNGSRWVRRAYPHITRTLALFCRSLLSTSSPLLDFRFLSLPIWPISPPQSSRSSWLPSPVPNSRIPACTQFHIRLGTLRSTLTPIRDLERMDGQIHMNSIPNLIKTFSGLGRNRHPIEIFVEGIEHQTERASQIVHEAGPSFIQGCLMMGTHNNQRIKEKQKKKI